MAYDLTDPVDAESVARTLQALIGDQWRDWSDEAVGAVAYVLITCLEQIGWDNPPTWPVPFVRLAGSSPAPHMRPIYVLRPPPGLAEPVPAPDPPKA